MRNTTIRTLFKLLIDVTCSTNMFNWDWYSSKHNKDPHYENLNWKPWISISQIYLNCKYLFYLYKLDHTQLSWTLKMLLCALFLKMAYHCYSHWDYVFLQPQPWWNTMANPILIALRIKQGNFVKIFVASKFWDKAPKGHW